MHILFTGGSSFTGMWFVRELAKAGHRVTAPLLHSKESYTGIRKQRVEILQTDAEIFEDCPFGSDSFLQLIDSGERWDALCHHAAAVTDYKSPTFNFVRALENNTRNLSSVIEALKKKGCGKIILTGSVFEQGEGRGTDDLRAVSPYGLSKGLTSDVFSYYSTLQRIKLGKFVIPNPFGPYEEERFTAYLMKKWLSGEAATVSHPAYIRDNIHVSLLAKAYVQFVEKMVPSPGFERINPSQYAGPQGEFAQLFAEEMRKRIPYPCELHLMEQREFPEPLARVNTDSLDAALLKWDAAQAWDEMAQFYMRSK